MALRSAILRATPSLRVWRTSSAHQAFDKPWIQCCSEVQRSISLTSFRPAERTWQAGQERRRSLAEERLPLSEKARTLNFDFEKNRQDPFIVLPDLLASQPVDPELVRVCLIAAMDRIMKDIPKRKERKAFILSKDPRLGHTLLEYMWKDVDYWLSVLSKDHRANLSLCYFAVAEGLDNLILDWVTVHNKLIVSINGRPTAMWRGQLLRNLCHAYSMHDGPYGLDDALQTFFRARERAVESRADGSDLHLDLYTAARGLTSLLSTGTYYQTSEALYDQFTTVADDVFKQKHAAEARAHLRDNDAKNMATLSLYHPIRPDASLALQVLRTRLQTFMSMPKDDELVRRNLSRFLVRTALVATANGQADEASEVATMYRKIFAQDMPGPTGYHTIVGQSWKQERKDSSASALRAKSFKRLDL